MACVNLFILTQPHGIDSVSYIPSKKRHEKRNSPPSAVVGYDAHATNSAGESSEGIRHHQ